MTPLSHFSTVVGVGAKLHVTIPCKKCDLSHNITILQKDLATWLVGVKPEIAFPDLLPHEIQLLEDGICGACESPYPAPDPPDPAFFTYCEKCTGCYEPVGIILSRKDYEALQLRAQDPYCIPYLKHAEQQFLATRLCLQCHNKKLLQEEAASTMSKIFSHMQDIQNRLEEMEETDDLETLTDLGASLREEVETMLLEISFQKKKEEAEIEKALQENDNPDYRRTQ